MEVLCVSAGAGAAAHGEPGKAASPGTESVLVHLSQNPGLHKPKLGEMKVLGVSEEGQPEELLFELRCLRGVH